MYLVMYRPDKGGGFQHGLHQPVYLIHEAPYRRLRMADYSSQKVDDRNAGLP